MGGNDSICTALVSPHTLFRYILYDVAVGVPSLAFLVFLGLNLKAALRKLRRSGSAIMTTYYGFLWTVSLLNLLRVFVQIAQTEASHPTLWNWLWIITRFGLELMEISVVVFLLQGYQFTRQEVLVRTLGVSGGLAALDTLLKIVFIFVLKVPLFLYGGGASSGGDLRWSKWSYWTFHALVFLLLYTGILVLPHTQQREMLPAKPSFFRYITVMCAINAAAMVGAITLGLKFTSGYCIYGATEFIYYAIYPPLLYVTFLQEFFASEEVNDETLLTEMRESGYFAEYDSG